MNVAKRVSPTLVLAALLFTVACESPTGFESMTSPTLQPDMSLAHDDGFVVNRFGGTFWQWSPCDGQRIGVSGTNKVGIRETVLDSGEERVLLWFYFWGQTGDYILRVWGHWQFKHIAETYDVTATHGVWTGLGPVPDFETYMDGTITVRNGVPVGSLFRTTSSRCLD